MLLLLGLWAWALAATVELRTDLDFFMPRATTPAIQLLGAKSGEGSASGLILLALSGAAPENLAKANDDLADRLEKSGLFRFVANGRFRVSPDIADALFQHRYLVSPQISEADFTTTALRRDLKNALRSLATMSGMAIAKYLPSDPTGRMLKIADYWKGASQTNLRHGVWFSGDGRRSLLMVQTVAPGLDFDAQQITQGVIAKAFAAANEGGAIQLEASGPAVFAIQASQRMRKELQLLTTISGVLVAGLLLAAYRSLSVVMVLALPLAAGILAAITAVTLVFGYIHGIALTFGITLLGVAIDYPVHLTTHASDEVRTSVTVRQIWPTMRLGALTTAAGFLPFALSSFPGLSQMGLFAIVGLTAALAATRWIVPLFNFPLRVAGDVQSTPGWLTAMDRMRVLRPVVLTAVLAGMAVFFLGQRTLFDDDLGKLSPVPEAAKLLDRELREAAGAPDVRYLVMVEGETPEAVLQRSENLSEELDALVKDGGLVGYDMAARYLPSIRTQIKRQQALPDPDTLRQALADAQTGLPFRGDTFGAFLSDVEAARTAPPISYEGFRTIGLSWIVEPFMLQFSGKWIGIIAPIGLKDPDQLAQLIASRQDPNIRFLDLKAEAEDLVRNYREEGLLLIGLGVLALLAVLGPGLRSLGSLVRVAAPVAISVIATVGVLLLLNNALTLFNLLSLLLVTGVGLDYALFFNRYSANLRDRARVVRAVVICSATTISVFGVLAFSEMSVLRGIGLTVSVGTALALLLTPIFATRRSVA